MAGYVPVRVVVDSGVNYVGIKHIKQFFLIA